MQQISTQIIDRLENELLGLESIAYQITDVLEAVAEDYPTPLSGLRADGGAAQNAYLMQFLSDLTGLPITVTRTDAMSAFGAAHCAGIALGLYDPSLDPFEKASYTPSLPQSQRTVKIAGWRRAVAAARGLPAPRKG